MDDSDTWIMVGIVALLVCGILGILFFFYPVSCITTTESAVVLDKIYTPKSGGTGNGVGISSDGKPVIMTYSNSSPEEYKLVYKFPTGKVSSDKVSLETYYKYKIGDKIPIQDCTSKSGLVTSLIRP